MNVKSIPKKAIIGICIAVIAFVVIIVVALSSSGKVDLNKYMTVEVTGANGYGRVNSNFDWEAMKKEYSSKVKFKKQTNASKDGGFYEGLDEFLADGDPLEFMMDSGFISLDFTPYERLSNGDVVNYHWSINPSLYNLIDCKLEYKDGSYKVSGLEEISTFNPFENLDVTFFGSSPNGQVSYTYSGDGLGSSDFICDKNNGLSNGDTVVIYISDSMVDTIAGNTGMIPEPLQMEYKVEGLDSYVTAYSEINKDNEEKIKAYSEDVIYSMIAKDYDDETQVEDLSYEGYILGAEKSDAFWGNHNYLYMIYSANISIPGEFEPTKVYFPVEFKDLLSTGGELTYQASSRLSGYSKITGRWSTYGYTLGTKLYSDLVTANRANYDIEVSDAIEALSK